MIKKLHLKLQQKCFLMLLVKNMNFLMKQFKVFLESLLYKLKI